MFCNISIDICTYGFLYSILHQWKKGSKMPNFGKPFVRVLQVFYVQFVIDGSSKLYNIQFYCSWIKVGTVLWHTCEHLVGVVTAPIGFIVHITYVIFARQFHHKSSHVPFMEKTFRSYFFMSGVRDKWIGNPFNKIKGIGSIVNVFEELSKFCGPKKL